MRDMTTDIHPAPKPEKQDHLRVLSNGAVYDMRKKRIVDSRSVTTKITKENSVAMQSRQHELKRAALARAANAVAAQGGGVDGREMIGNLAYVEAIGEAMTMKALTINDPKAVDAARFIFTETGIAEAKAPETQNNTINVIAVPDDVARTLLELKRMMSASIPTQLHDTIDADVESE
jgi:hypothetical protein